MPKVAPFPELTEEKFQELRKRAQTKREFQRVQSLYLHQRGCRNVDIAASLSIGTATVTRIWQEYHNKGEDGFLNEGRGGRYNENMTEAEEDAFLKPFLKKANEGGVLIVQEIHESYMKKAGKKVPKSTIYAMLHRHSWRKIAPRPSHPKSNPEAREIFKASFPPHRLGHQS